MAEEEDLTAEASRSTACGAPLVSASAYKRHLKPEDRFCKNKTSGGARCWRHGGPPSDTASARFARRQLRRTQERRALARAIEDTTVHRGAALVVDGLLLGVVERFAVHEEAPAENHFPAEVVAPRSLERVDVQLRGGSPWSIRATREDRVRPGAFVRTVTGYTKVLQRVETELAVTLTWGKSRRLNGAFRVVDSGTEADWEAVVSRESARRKLLDRG